LLAAILSLIDDFVHLPLIFGNILGIFILVFSIVALVNFNKKKLPKITKILPICELVMYGLVLILGIINLIYILNHMDINSQLAEKALSVSSILFNIFRISMASYIIYFFRKK